MENFETTAKEVARRKCPVNFFSLASQKGDLLVEAENLHSELEAQTDREMKQPITSERIDMATQTDDDSADASTQTEEGDPPMCDRSVGPSEISTCLAQHVSSSTSAQFAQPAVNGNPI